ncbi:hypothetical protein DBR06_SOUSAS2110055, partial [Sousa chinensis]
SPRPSPRLRGQRTHLSSDPPGYEGRALRAEKLLGCGWLRGLERAAPWQRTAPPRILPRGSAHQTRESLGEPWEQGRPTTMGTLCQQPLQDFHVSQFSRAGT